jgi:hypothetical protein
MISSQGSHIEFWRLLREGAHSPTRLQHIARRLSLRPAVNQIQCPFAVCDPEDSMHNEISSVWSEARIAGLRFRSLAFFNVLFQSQRV